MVRRRILIMILGTFIGLFMTHITPTNFSFGVFPNSVPVIADSPPTPPATMANLPQCTPLTDKDIHVSDFALSPDGKKIAFVPETNGTVGDKEHSGLYISDVDGSNRHLITNENAVFAPAWSPNSQQIAFIDFISPPPAPIEGPPTVTVAYVQIDVINIDGTGLHTLVSHDEFQMTYVQSNLHIEWSPDGQRIAFTTDLNSSAASALYITTLESSTIYTNSFGVSAFAWSPDSTYIAFAHDKIYTIQSDGSRQKAIVQNVVDIGFPTWSPDGTQIAFSADALYIVNADDSNLHSIVSGHFSNPAWSPDGKVIAFKDLQHNIYITTIDGSNIYSLVYTPYHNMTHLVWTADSKSLIFAMYGRLYKADLAKPCITTA